MPATVQGKGNNTTGGCMNDGRGQVIKSLYNCVMSDSVPMSYDYGNRIYIARSYYC